jgi:hypothetical protein
MPIAQMIRTTMTASTIKVEVDIAELLYRAFTARRLS